jgi:hypothetical protein
MPTRATFAVCLQGICRVGSKAKARNFSQAFRAGEHNLVIDDEATVRTLMAEADVGRSGFTFGGSQLPNLLKLQPGPTRHARGNRNASLFKRNNSL